MEYNVCCVVPRGMAIFRQMIVIPLFFCIACSGGKNEVIDIVFDRENSYTMKTTEILTFISDSGVTRFKMEAKEWYVFDEASEPYWYFPEKIYGEILDTLFRTESSFEADTAYYYTKTRLWKFIDHVKVVNLEGEQFETSLLFWDESEEKIYSDQFIRITRCEFINTGVGFEANQTLTKYQIYNAKAEIPVQENTPADTLAIE